MRAAVFLIMSALLLVGCDKLTGAADQKVADAEAIGYACRVSQKTPEACMKENEAQSPSSVLDGWKSADKDIKDRAIDITMGNPPAAMVSSAEAENPAAEAATAEGKEGAAPEAAKNAEPGNAPKENKGKE